MLRHICRLLLLFSNVSVVDTGAVPTGSHLYERNTM